MGHGEGAGAREGVILDVGLGEGAVVVITPGALAGREVELTRLGAGDRRVHAVVHERWTGRAPVHAAVFVDVPEGEVEIWLGGAGQVGTTPVRSGEVATVDLRGREPAV